MPLLGHQPQVLLMQPCDDDWLHMISRTSKLRQHLTADHMQPNIVAGLHEQHLRQVTTAASDRRPLQQVAAISRSPAELS